MTMKKVGQSLYLHVSAWDELPFHMQKRVARAKELARISYEDVDETNLIKISPKNVSFILSSDWDTAMEPRIDWSYIVHPDGATTFKDYRDTHIIYHHKWAFCAASYSGFNRNDSMVWSQYWTEHPAVKSLAKRDPHWRSRIGNFDYWKKNVLDVIT